MERNPNRRPPFLNEAGKNDESLRPPVETVTNPGEAAQTVAELTAAEIALKY